MAQNSSGLARDASFCIFGAKALLSFIHAMESQIEGARAGADIEYIHRLRVASRRTRAALYIFGGCFPKGKSDTWRRQVKKVTQKLGQARDTDIQIQFIDEYRKSISDSKLLFGVDYLLAKHKEKRAGMQPDVVRVLDELRVSRIIESMKAACENNLRRERSSNERTTLYINARNSIRMRLDEFLSNSDCIFHEDEAEKHHQTRIAAKRLRYTMEIFQALYDDKLGSEIATFKEIQDVLGEMHDCDVWVEYIPIFIQASKADFASSAGTMHSSKDIEWGLNRLVDYVKKKRHTLYRAFVTLWKRCISQNLFGNLCEKVDLSALITRQMPQKIALIADVHGNIHALSAVLADAKKHGAQAILNAGDLVGYGAFPDEVVSKLSSECSLSIIGNFDTNVIAKIGKKSRGGSDKAIAIAYAVQNLSKSSVKYLKTLPPKICMRVREKTIIVVHGSPDDANEHITPHTPEQRLRRIAQSEKADIIVTGHSHMPFSRRVGRTVFINPGSVGRPNDGDYRASYALLTLEPFFVEFVRVDYDVESEVKAIRKRGLPEHFAQMLISGVSLEAVLTEERTKAASPQERRNFGPLIEEVRADASKYGVDWGHASHVTSIALKLFDGTTRLHQLGAEERYWLECAALLHDIGWSRGGKGHHKSSLSMILNDKNLPFVTRERYIVGSVARYHRKRPPQDGDYNFALLNPPDRFRVNVLSALLRIADGLDASHISTVKPVRVYCGASMVKIVCNSEADYEHESFATSEKKDLFEKVFKKRLLIEWLPLQKQTK
ncbi:MAG: YfcE family phosphodiesterase [Thermoplasmata archaeon]